jgi:hypothetical protein
MKNEKMNELYGYLLTYAKSACFCIENAEDITQEVLLTLLPKLDFNRELGEIKSYARFKMFGFLKDKYRFVKSTGIQFIHECPTSYSFSPSDDEETLDIIAPSGRQGSSFKFSTSFNERPDPFLPIEYTEMCASLVKSFDGKVKDIFVAMLNAPKNNTEIAEHVGVTRQYVEQVINEKIRPRVKAFLNA